MPSWSEIFVFTQLITDFEVLKQEWSLMNIFQKEQKQEAQGNFDYCQRTVQADSTAHSCCKMVNEWNTHPYYVDMP